MLRVGTTLFRLGQPNSYILQPRQVEEKLPIRSPLQLCKMESVVDDVEHQRQADTLRPEYPRGVSSKFGVDGKVQHFPGNTIISHLSPSSDLYASMLVLHEKLLQSNLSSVITLLPPSSWHMTVFEGICDEVRKPGFWPSDLAVDAPLELSLQKNSLCLT